MSRYSLHFFTGAALSLLLACGVPPNHDDAGWVDSGAANPTDSAATDSGAGDGGLDASFPEIDAGSFTVQLPSALAGDAGLLVRVFHPSTAHRRYPEGAPVSVLVSGGHGPGTLSPPGVSPAIDKHGCVQIQFLMPGGSAAEGSSGGTYDFRGPACKRALADVIRNAQGKLRASDGKLLAERLPIALSSNVGVIGSSNGGNLSVTTFASHGAELAGLAWSSPWPGLRAALAFDATAAAQITNHLTNAKVPVSGVLYVDANSNGTRDPNEFYFQPLGGPGPGSGIKGYLSVEAMTDIDAEKARLFPSGWPSWLATLAERMAYWAERDGSRVFSQAHAALPEMLVIALGSATEHAQRQPDHPNVIAGVHGWLDVGQPFVRLNPDAVYLTKVVGAPGSYSDNPANVRVPYPGIAPMLSPDSADPSVISAAVIELADRFRSGNQATNLDALLIP